MLQNEYWHRFPWLLMAVVVTLVAVGVLGVYAASGGDTDPRPFYNTLWGRQIVWAVIGLAVFAAALVPSYLRIARASYVLYGATLLVLVLLAAMRAMHWRIPGLVYPINYAYSWISLPGGVKFQPSELTKIAFIMALAYYLRYRKNYRTLGGLIPPFLMALIPTALVLYQPDLGTAMLFLPVLFLMLFAAGARVKHLAAVVLVGLLMVPVFYGAMRGYQRLRIDSWLLNTCAERLHFALQEAELRARAGVEDGDAAALARQAHLNDQEKVALVREITSMWRFRLWRLASRLAWSRASGRAEAFDAARDRLFRALRGPPTPETFTVLRQFFGTLLHGPGHHLWQAKIAVGAGGLAGRGWLQGTQTRYELLPEAPSDSLFASLAEQFGFLGAAGVVILYGLLFVFGIDVSFSTTEPYGRLIVVGVIALFAAQSFLNLAMSLGLMPITGIPLPLMSYGGSSMVSSFLALGLLVNVALRRLFLIAPRPFEWRE